MNKNLLLLCTSVMLLTSCSIDDSGDISVSPWFWIVLILAIILFVILGVQGQKEAKQTETKMGSMGMKPTDFVDVSMYAGGHPDLNESIKGVKIRKEENVLAIYEWPYITKMPVKKAEIPIDAISNIIVQDATTIEKKITVGRMLLVGVFAFAWRKKKKNEMAFVEIDWKKGKFDNETMFCFEGKDAAQKANTARNGLIKLAE